MTRVLLLRHASHDLAGKALAGRMSGLGLNAAGWRQAQDMVEPLLRHRIDAIHSSPQQRTRETATPVAQRIGIPIRVADEFDEVDFGAWTGLAFDAVRARDPALWDTWVDRRSQATPPQGEPFTQVGKRVAAGLQRLRSAHPEGTVLVVSHADVIKATLAGVMGLSLDKLETFEIACASLSIVETGDGWGQVKLVNGTLLEDGQRKPLGCGSSPQ